MRKGDVQLAIPYTEFTATKAVIEAIAAPVEGMIAYASDTHEIGTYGASWEWQPAPVEASVDNNLVAFNGIAGTQKDSGIAGADVVSAVSLKHAAATIGAMANGLSIAGQEISLAAATAVVPGAMRAAYADKLDRYAIAAGKTLTVFESVELTAGAAGYVATVPESLTIAGRDVMNEFTAEQKISATVDTALSAEYISAIANRDFSAVADWAGTNWLIPLSDALTDVTVVTAEKTFTRVSGSFIADGFQVGMSVTWSGFAKPGTVNNGTFVITALTALVMTCSAATLSDEVPADYVSVSATSPVWSHAVAGANETTLANAYLASAPVAGECYQIVVTVVTKTANTLTIYFGGVAMTPIIGKTVGTLTGYTFNIITTDAGVLTVIPGATWLGWIDNISVKKITPASSILTGKLFAGTTVIETRMPNATSVGVGIGAVKFSVGACVSAFGMNAAHNNTGTYVSAFGMNAAYNNTGACVSAFGVYAAQKNTGAYVSAFGVNAAYNNTGAYVSAFGVYAAQNNTGALISAFGYAAAYENTTGVGGSAFGYNAGRGFTDNNYCVFVGCDSRTSVGALTNAIVIGANARGSKSNQVTLGHTDIVETLLRGSVLVGTTTDGMTAGGSLAIAQDLAHRGTLAGFMNTTPVVKQTGCAVPTDLDSCIVAITALRTALNNYGLTTVV